MSVGITSKLQTAVFPEVSVVVIVTVVFPEIIVPARGDCVVEAILQLSAVVAKPV